MNCLNHVKTRLTALAAAMFLLGGLPLVANEGRPPARELLALVRANQASQEQAFTGRLRTSGSRERIVIPFRLTMNSGEIIYRFENPPEEIRVRLGENDSRLERRGGMDKNSALSAPVRGTDVTYEDLAMKFLYWSNAKTVAEDLVGSRSCWVVQAVPPSRKASQYDMVRLWIEKSGALLKAECYNAGKRVRRFEVRGVQRAPQGGGYILKSMRIHQIGDNGRDGPPMYLEVTPS